MFALKFVCFSGGCNQQTYFCCCSVLPLSVLQSVSIRRNNGQAVDGKMIMRSLIIQITTLNLQFFNIPALNAIDFLNIRKRFICIETSKKRSVFQSHRYLKITAALKGADCKQSKQEHCIEHDHLAGSTCWQIHMDSAFRSNVLVS